MNITTCEVAIIYWKTVGFRVEKVKSGKIAAASLKIYCPRTQQMPDQKSDLRENAFLFKQPDARPPFQLLEAHCFWRISDLFGLDNVLKHLEPFNFRLLAMR
jgi:hypothetical protein